MYAIFNTLKSFVTIAKNVRLSLKIGNNAENIVVMGIEKLVQNYVEHFGVKRVINGAVDALEKIMH